MLYIAQIRKPETMKKIYISGPMTGLPDYNYPAFNVAAAQLRAAGFHVESPAENKPPECGTWEGWMRIALKQLIDCHAVAVLPGWEKSKGALVEIQVASQLGMKVLPVDMWMMEGAA